MDAEVSKRLTALREEQRNLQRGIESLQDQLQNTAAMITETGQTLMVVMERLRLLEERLSGE